MLWGKIKGCAKAYAFVPTMFNPIADECYSIDGRYTCNTRDLFNTSIDLLFERKGDIQDITDSARVLSIDTDFQEIDCRWVNRARPI